MSQQAEDYRKRVIDYFNTTKLDYRILWRSNRSLGLHFGYYDGQHRTHDAAILNINRKLADLVGVSSADHVLDAGCGIGGSSLWLAANRGCKVTGINIVPEQLQQAKLLAKQRSLQRLVDFRLADFANTKLKNDSFTVVWGLESIVHAKDKQAVLKEAFRLLKPGGRMVIAEYLLTKDTLEPEDQAELDLWLKGWAMPSLLTEQKYRSFAHRAGFTDFTVHDWTEQVRPSFNRLNKFVKIFKPVAPLLNMLGLANKGQQNNLAASEAQMRLLARNLWRYKVILAKKPGSKS